MTQSNTYSNDELLKIVKDKLKKETIDKPWLIHNIHFLAVSGSRLYGTNNENSDWDIRGVCFSPKQYWVGGKKFNQIELKEDENKIGITIYDIKRYIELLSENSPNIVELLFIEKSKSLIYSDFWSRYLKSFKDFITTSAYKNYSNYGLSQTKKVMNSDKVKEGRKDLVEKYGYDTKFAMHAVRLLDQSCELMLTKHLTFPRQNAQFLKEIREGKFKTKEEFKAFWEENHERIEKLTENSILDDRPYHDLKTKLLMSIYDNYIAYQIYFGIL